MSGKPAPVLRGRTRAPGWSRDPGETQDPCTPRDRVTLPIAPNPINFYGLVTSMAPKLMIFVGFGAHPGQGPSWSHNWPCRRHVFFVCQKLIGFGTIHGPKPYTFIGFGTIHGPKPYKFIGFGTPGGSDAFVQGRSAGRPPASPPSCTMAPYRRADLSTGKPRKTL